MVDLGIGLLCVCVGGRGEGYRPATMRTAVCDVTLGLGTRLGEPPSSPPPPPPPACQGWSRGERNKLSGAEAFTLLTVQPPLYSQCIYVHVNSSDITFEDKWAEPIAWSPRSPDVSLLT